MENTVTVNGKLYLCSEVETNCEEYVSVKFLRVVVGEYLKGPYGRYIVTRPLGKSEVLDKACYILVNIETGGFYGRFTEEGIQQLPANEFSKIFVIIS